MNNLNKLNIFKSFIVNWLLFSDGNFFDVPVITGEADHVACSEHVRGVCGAHYTRQAVLARYYSTC